MHFTKINFSNLDVGNKTIFLSKAVANKVVFMMKNLNLCSSFTESSRAAMQVDYRISQRNIMNIIPEN